MTLRRQKGALLLMVSLALATIAALALGMNRAAGMDAGSVRRDYDMRAAGYLAEAGVASSKWVNQVSGCTSKSLAAVALGAGTFSATVPESKGKAKKLDITASGAVNGDTVRTLAPRQVTLYDLLNIETVKLTKGARNVTIDMWKSGYDDDDPLALTYGTSHALLYWDLNDIKTDARVLSASLTLTHAPFSGATGTVALHRVTTRWNDDANWTRPREEAVRWNGGDYIGAASASTGITFAGTAAWEVTALVDDWFSGRAPNEGLLLRLTAAAPTLRFYSLDAASSRRPVLQVVSARAC